MGPELDTQSFARYAIGVEISITILVFILDYFQEKIKTDFFKKKTILGPFWPSFAQIWTKINFPGRKGSVSFQIFQLSTTVPKIRKKLMCYS